MDHKKANRAFLYMIVITIVFTVLLALLVYYRDLEMGLMANNFFSEMLALIPAMAVVLFYGESVIEAFNIRKIKIATAFLSLLYVVLLYPLVMLVSSISMFFVENTVAEMSSQIVEAPMWQMFLSIGLFGPFVEEVVFRGIFFGSYKKSGRILGAIFMSSVIFGIAHLNFSQFAYGTVMGIMFALMVEATGSVLSSFIAHAAFNSFEVYLMYSTAGVVEEAERLSTDMFQEGTMGLYLASSILVALICTALALCVVYKMAQIEGRSEALASVFKGGKRDTHLITIPAVIALLLAAIFMGYVEYASRVLM